mmetsp:Transcript_2502/g.3608  ORF Transcript_2502/g.3608 Transcript_2502/m.3608 type:complete len:684 (+) Transcript_2502:67-2118(+)
MLDDDGIHPENIPNGSGKLSPEATVRESPATSVDGQLEASQNGHFIKMRSMSRSTDRKASHLKTPSPPASRPPRPPPPSRYKYSTNCRTPDRIITAPKIFPCHFNIVLPPPPPPVVDSSRSSSASSTPSSANSSLYARLKTPMRIRLYMNSLNNRMKQFKRAFQEKKRHRYEEVKQVGKELEMRRNYMQHELVAVLQKREHIRDSLLAEAADGLYRHVKLLKEQIRRCELISQTERNSYSATGKCVVPLQRLLAGSKSIQENMKRERSIKEELKKVNAEISLVSATISRRESQSRRGRALEALKCAREFYSKHPLHVSAPEAESSFECLLFDQRHPEGKALAKWENILIRKTLRSPRRSRTSSNMVLAPIEVKRAREHSSGIARQIAKIIRKFVAGFASEHSIPSSLVVPYLQILFERAIIRRLRHALPPLVVDGEPDLNTQQQLLRKQLLWMSKLTEGQLGISELYQMPLPIIETKEVENGQKTKEYKDADNAKTDQDVKESDPEESYTSKNRPYASAISALEEACSLMAPSDILKGVLHCAQIIYKTSSSYAAERRKALEQKGGRAPDMGADNFFPILLYVVSHAEAMGLPQAVRTARLLGPIDNSKNNQVTNGSNKVLALSASSEEMYYLTCLEGALKIVLSADPVDYRFGRSPFTSRSRSDAQPLPKYEKKSVSRSMCG